MTSRRDLGNQAEQLALAYLQQAGLSLVERNFSSRYGEIDLIMQQMNTLIFIEVRSRSDKNYDIAASIDRRKQRRIIQTAHHYLQCHHPILPPCRLDVVTVDTSQQPPHIEWLRNAFTA
jgi:putative endonuclease